ncbi:hypothetical protein J7E45_16075 [Microbacterium sp. ISL-59]|nr:hypothetical protein [Microbacterium sp. ISL-59]MBT2497130.1 hypothetical protein [Microbacterium sp. ISL-59]
MLTNPEIASMLEKYRIETMPDNQKIATLHVLALANIAEELRLAREDH